jgi:hypothetical protein
MRGNKKEDGLRAILCLQASSDEPLRRFRHDINFAPTELNDTVSQRE